MKAINTTCDGWMRSHPSKTMTLYDIPGIIKIAVPLAHTGEHSGWFNENWDLSIQP